MRGWLRAGAIVVADNIRVPGAPRYRAYMRSQQGREWQTVEHKTHGEYGSVVPDLVLESEYLGALTGYRARGWAPAQTSRSACTVTRV